MALRGSRFLAIQPLPNLPVLIVNIVLFYVGGALAVIQILVGTRILTHPVHKHIV